jgi:hypothetical protein
MRKSIANELLKRYGAEKLYAMSRMSVSEISLITCGRQIPQELEEKLEAFFWQNTI